MILDHDYKLWIIDIKSKIRSAQMKAALAVNASLIEFYWDLGKMIAEKQATAAWGSKSLAQVSKDLKDEFPEMSGFSESNLKTCKLFYQYFTSRSQAVNQLGLTNKEFGSQPVNQLENSFESLNAATDEN